MERAIWCRFPSSAEGLVHAFQRNRAGRDWAPEGRKRVDRPGTPLELRESLPFSLES